MASNCEAQTAAIHEGRLREPACRSRNPPTLQTQVQANAGAKNSLSDALTAVQTPPSMKALGFDLAIHKTTREG